MASSTMSPVRRGSPMSISTLPAARAHGQEALVAGCSVERHVVAGLGISGAGAERRHVVLDGQDELAGRCLADRRTDEGGGSYRAVRRAAVLRGARRPRDARAVSAAACITRTGPWKCSVTCRSGSAVGEGLHQDVVGAELAGAAPAASLPRRER